MSPLSAQIRYIVAALLPFAVLAGCASAEKERAAQAQLEKARMAYQQAQADPNVQKYAASRLAEAQKAVQGAEHAKDLDDRFLNKNPNRNLLIEGHTDNTGGTDLNIKLSQQRAEAVRDLLVSRGVSPQRITTRGYGPKYPLVSNESAAGRQQNRRIDVLVLNEGVSAERAAR